MAKKIIGILLFQLLFFVSTYASLFRNPEPNLGAIKVEQSFSIFRHCTGEKNKPVLKTMNLNIREVENSLKDSANYSGYFDIPEFYDADCQPNFTLKMSLYAGNMRHNNACEYRLDSTPGSHSSGEYERRSACGMVV